MHKILCLLMFCSFFLVSRGQQYDVKLTNKIYSSYFNKAFKEPTVVFTSYIMQAGPAPAKISNF